MLVYEYTSCSSVQYNNYNRSGPGARLWNRTRVYVAKREKIVTTEQQQQQQQQHHVFNMYFKVYKTGFSIAQDTSIIDDRTYFYTGNKKKKATKKKKSCTGLNLRRRGQRDSKQPICSRTAVLT